MGEGAQETQAEPPNAGVEVLETLLCQSLTGDMGEFPVCDEDFTPDSLTWKERWDSPNGRQQVLECGLSALAQAEPAACAGSPR